MGWLVDEWSLLSDELIPAVTAGAREGSVGAAVCGTARNAVALTLALQAAPEIRDFEVFLCPAPSYSDRVGFSRAEMGRLACLDRTEVLERDGRRWLPTRQILEKVLVDQPNRPVDLVVIGTGPARRCSAGVLAWLRPGGHVLVENDDAVDLLDAARFRSLDSRGWLARKSEGAGCAAAAAEPAPCRPTLAEVVDRAELIETHYPLARALARRYSRVQGDLPDLEQAAFAALVRAAGSYDPGRNTAFASFAAASVAGELKRYFRDRTWGLRVPRSLQETYLQVKAARDELVQQLGASPTVAQIAGHLGIDEEMVLSAMEAGDNYRPVSLDAPTRGGEEAGTDVPTVDGAFDRGLDLQVLGEALPALEPLQRLIVKRVFFDGRTQREVAVELGVSQMQVSRLLGRALVSLRQAMGVPGP